MKKTSEARRADPTASRPILGTHVRVYDDVDVYDVEPPPLVGPVKPMSVQSPFGVFANLTNSIVGAGVIAIPHAMAEGGFVPVLVLLLLSGYLTHYSMNVLVRLGHAHGAHSFEGLAQLAFGNWGYYAVCFFQFTFSFGANCSYMLVIADTLPIVIGHMNKMHFANGEPIPSTQTPWYIVLATDRACCVELVVRALALLILLPICIHRNFASLEKFAGLSIMSVSFCACVILYKCVVDYGKYPATSHGPVFDYLDVHRNIFPAIGTIAFAYVCQHQTFLVFNTMTPRDPVRFARISRVGVSFAVGLIFTMSIPGYLLFLESTRSDLFLNFTDYSDKMIQVCRLLTAFNMILTYPQEFMVARHTLQSLVEHYARTKQLPPPPPTDLFYEQSMQKHRPGAAMSDSDGEVTKSPLLPPPSTSIWTTDDCNSSTLPRLSSSYAMAWHVGLTLLLLGTTLLISLIDRRLGDITSLTGSFSAVALTFVLPAACHLRLGPPPKTRELWKDTIMPWCTIVFGTFAFFISTGWSIYAIHIRHLTHFP
ncbi:Aste57867_23422 [Aphanomyces stellatus]|uniref:Aste57867_23422 protein n=1 Tax=Aphanomyces stellatus TaxID=120398 RepID=A0A485LML2_9STRA|nr:hypothetical protein As57867_023351 [Aphanomyces stellatus]VFU00068.1 Aste57867_23422 [Aphanomyces stellatus]